MAAIVGDSFLTRKTYAVTRPNTSGTAAVTDGVLVRDDTLQKTSTTTGTTISSVDTGTTGVKFTHVFKLRFPFTVTTAARTRTRIKWEVTNAGPATTTGRVNVDLQKNGGAIGGVTKANGTTQAVSAPGTFTDANLTVDIPSTTFSAGDTLDVRVEFEVMVASAGTTLAVKLHHDPATSGNELIYEVDV